MSRLESSTPDQPREAPLRTTAEPPGLTRVAVLDTSQPYTSAFLPFLGREGFSAVALSDSVSLMRMLAEGALDLIILDLKLGTENGVDAIRRIRLVSNIPCVVLSATASELDRVVALEMGADHFLSKNFTHREVLAHLRALLRRSTLVGSTQSRPGGWRILPEQREVLRPDGAPCRLTSAEYEVLQVLATASGRAVSRDVISTQVFARPYRVGDRTVDMLITRLRRKIERDADNPRMIKTIRAIGYSFAGFMEDSEDY